MQLGIGVNLFNRQKEEGVPVRDGLVAEYRFDEGRGQVLCDYSGNGNHGQLGSTREADTNDPLWTPQGLEFDGVDDRVQCTTKFEPSLLYEGYTVLVVANIKDIDKEFGLLDYSYGYWYVFALGNYSSAAAYLRGVITVDGKRYDTKQGNSIDVGQWAVYGITFNGNELTANKNGVVIPETTVLVPSGSIGKGNSERLTIGARCASFQNYGVNAVADVVGAYIYNRCLSNEEIAEIYNYLKALLAGRGVTLA